MEAAAHFARRASAQDTTGRRESDTDEVRTEAKTLTLGTTESVGGEAQEIGDKRQKERVLGIRCRCRKKSIIPLPHTYLPITVPG